MRPLPHSPWTLLPLEGGCRRSQASWQLPPLLGAVLTLRDQDRHPCRSQPMACSPWPGTPSPRSVQPYWAAGCSKLGLFGLRAREPQAGSRPCGGTGSLLWGCLLSGREEHSGLCRPHLCKPWAPVGPGVLSYRCGLGKAARLRQERDRQAGLTSCHHPQWWLHIPKARGYGGGWAWQSSCPLQPLRWELVAKALASGCGFGFGVTYDHPILALANPDLRMPGLESNCPKMLSGWHPGPQPLTPPQVPHGGGREGPSPWGSSPRVSVGGRQRRVSAGSGQGGRRSSREEEAEPKAVAPPLGT